MKKILILLIIFMGCSKDNPVSVFESESYNIELKNWGEIATRNSSSTYPDWNGKPGMLASHWINNTSSEDLKIEYTIHIRGARLQEDIARLILIGDSPLLSSTLGLLCRKTNSNLDPIDIIESNILLVGEDGFGIAFAESKPREEGDEGAVFDWGEWFSIYYSVTIRAFTFESLSKGGGFLFEYETEWIEIK